MKSLFVVFLGFFLFIGPSAHATGKKSTTAELLAGALEHCADMEDAAEARACADQANREFPVGEKRRHSSDRCPDDSCNPDEDDSNSVSAESKY